MKLLSAILLFALATITYAQGIAIGYPPANTTVCRGTNITVEIDRPDTLTGSTEIAVVIGIASCASFPCLPPVDSMGSILYNGPFNPQFSTPPSGKPPHQNFTVFIPPTFAMGPAQLNVAHFSLVGAGPFPFSQTLNTTIEID